MAAVAVAAATALPVAGCGGGKKGQPIPSAEASQITARLQEAERRNDPLRCHDLQRDTIPALQSLVNDLPPATDSDVKQTLSDGIDHLNNLVSEECNQQQTTTETTPTESVPSTETTTETTPSTETTNTNTDTNTTPSNTNTNTNTGTNTTPAPGGTPSPTDTSGGNANGNGGH